MTNKATEPTGQEQPEPNRATSTVAAPSETRASHTNHAALTQAESYVDGHLTRPAFVSIAILTFITFVGNFTQLQLTSALPTIVAEFHITVTTGQWLTSIFQLVMGVMVPLTAFLTRRFSTRQIVITSMVVFTIGSALSWLGPSFVLVLLGRILQAAGTGVMWPVLQITVFTIYPLSRRGMAMGTVGLAMSVAPAIGPTLGGWQTDANGWRSIFVSLTVIGVLCVIASALWLRDFGESDPTARADFFSVALSIFGFGGLMFGFTNIEAFPFTHPMVWLPLVIGLAGIVWFVLRQIQRDRAYREAESSETTESSESTEAAKRTQSSKAARSSSKKSAKPAEPPLLDLGVLKNKSFTVGTIIAMLAFFAFSSIMVIVPLYIQNDRGYSATMSGLIFLPGAIGQAISQFFGGKALDRFGARPVAMFGSIVLTLGTAMMSLIGPDTWIFYISICQFIRQIGMGFVLMPITTWSLNCLAGSEVSAGSAVTNTCRQIAGAVGAPVLVILMETCASTRAASGFDAISSSIFGVQWALRASALCCFIMVILVIAGVKGEGAGHTRDVISLHALRERRSRLAGKR